MSLGLTPVLFELGARPHPPRELYRSYLDQSHVFVGIYWQSYGWVAPGAEVSGIEDEYVLSAGKPRLLYVKRRTPSERPGSRTFSIGCVPTGPPRTSISRPPTSSASSCGTTSP